MSRYDEAVAELSQAKLENFVEERKRLAKELKQAGDADGSKRLSQRARPTISVWTVNQLYWRARPAFEHLFETAAPLRSGGLAGGAQHREALAKLREEAVKLLEQEGHAASDVTLRRVMTTLSALAASGGFDPDPPGALSSDRDPPGFEAIGIVGDAHDSHVEHKKEHAEEQRSHKPTEADRRAAAAERERARREQEAEREREELARKKLQAERRKLETELNSERRKLEAREKEVGRRRRELEQAEAALKESQDAVDAVEEQLRKLR